MADPEAVALLGLGVEAWNEWRQRDPRRRIDLNSIGLSGADLRHASFSNCDMADADLRDADARGAYFLSTGLAGARLDRGRFDYAKMAWSTLGRSVAGMEPYLRLKPASARDTSFIGADLGLARFDGTDLRGAHFGFADLAGTEFCRVDLSGASFERAILGETRFVAVDLSNVPDITSAEHHMPSFVSVDTLRLSCGRLPPSFLRGCGLSDVEIHFASLFQPTLDNEAIRMITAEIDAIRGRSPIQVRPVFISYSHADKAFVDMLTGALDLRGIRYWRDVHHMVAGRVDAQIERAIRLHPAVILVLSESSTRSDWVEHEATQARELAKALRGDVLCPLALDASWLSCDWSGALRTQIKKYNVLDFSQWQDEQSFQNQFAKLVDGLELFYQSETDRVS